MQSHIRKVIAILLVLGVGGLLWLAASSQLRADPRIVPTPTRVSNPIAESDNQPASELPGTKGPDYAIASPSFAGKVLHWAQTAYSHVSTSPDPANGKIITADIWVRVGKDGVPEKVHTTITLPNGNLWQESVAHGTQVTTRLGKVYAADPVLGRNYCKQELTENPKDLINYLPSYFDTTKLERDGFTPMEKQSRALPQTTSLSGITPARVIGDSSWNRWQRTRGINNMKQTDIFDVEKDGRVIFAQGKLTHPNGKVISDTWSEYGNIQVYDGRLVPNSAFDFSTQAIEECNE